MCTVLPIPVPCTAPCPIPMQCEYAISIGAEKIQRIGEVNINSKVRNIMFAVDPDLQWDSAPTYKDEHRTMRCFICRTRKSDSWKRLRSA